MAVRLQLLLSYFFSNDVIHVTKPRAVMIENESVACSRVSDAAILNVKTVAATITLRHHRDFSWVEVDPE